MDRINGADTIDIGSGRRGFQGQNAVAGIPGTEVTDAFLNGVQEEIMAVIERSGLAANPNSWSQLWEALQVLNSRGIPAAQLNRMPWLPVISIDSNQPPQNPMIGQIWVVGSNPTGAWAGQAGTVAEWDGQQWRFKIAQDGHGISLPDGRVFIRTDGAYTEKIALDAQSGKWIYSAGKVVSNTINVALSPSPTVVVDGMIIYIRLNSNVPVQPSLKVNNLEALPILRIDGTPFSSGDIQADIPAILMFNKKRNAWIHLNRADISKNSIIGFKAGGLPAGIKIPAGNVYTALPINQIVFDPDNNYNTKTGIFLVSQAGIYMITASAPFNTTSVGFVGCYISRNNVMVAEASANGYARKLAVSVIEKLNIGDRIQVVVQQNISDNAITMDESNIYQCTFSAVKVGD